MLDNYQTWCERVTDHDVAEQLLQMKNDDERRTYAFCQHLSFGTAGIRGIMDAGINCMNIYTVARATQGVATYVKVVGGNRAVISYDSRNNSTLFASITATVFANNGIEVFITADVQPTAFVSFATRQLNATVGVMITASHNSKEYNGYKVYNSHGVQIDVPTAEIISQYISEQDFFSINLNGYLNYCDNQVIKYISDELIDKYIECIYQQSQQDIGAIDVIYTPLNGAGYRIVPRVLGERGLKKLTVVREQSFINGDFTTCPVPNPEKKQALELGIEYMLKNDADILIATDPDCDRVGVAVNQQGQAIILTGNQVGVLLCDYLLTVRRDNGTLPDNPIVVDSIVTTKLINKIINRYNGSCVSVLTGFKYIGEYITLMESKGKQGDIILGFEESCGYLVGSYVRDKDGVVACMLIAQMASYHKSNGLTLLDRLNQIFDYYGRYEDNTVVLTFSGADGDNRRRQCMSKLRNTDFDSISGKHLQSKTDLLSSNNLQLPSADVLIYQFEGDNRIIVRPSGTEPLIKLYVSCCMSQDDAYAFCMNAEQFFKNIFIS
ncbi:MAG: phospho-sugar mutase [Clostridia bacterium]|nr:phospho-sugar mutase [Clostridia bacterium]